MQSRMRSRYNQPMQVTDSGRDSARALAGIVRRWRLALGAGRCCHACTQARRRPRLARLASTPRPSGTGHTGRARGTGRTAGRQRDIFRSGVDVVTTDVIVRDQQGQFVADLKKDEFDGLRRRRQAGRRLVHRSCTAAAPRTSRRRRRRRSQEGIILPPSRPTNDASGRIFLIFVDDLHLDFRNTGRIRELFKKICEGADSRRRHVRHRLDRPVVAVDRPDLRPQAARRGDREDLRRRAEAEGHPRRRRRAARVRRKSAIARTSRSRPPTTS